MGIARTIAAWATASETEQGPLELATQAEVDAGTSTDTAVTPETLKGWSAPPGGLIDVQRYTGNGTWNKPAGARLVEVFCIGAGGGSAKCTPGTSSEWRIAGSGGGGGFAYGMFLASGWGATVSVVVGNGGTAGTGTNGSGGTGGNSTFNGTSSPYVQGLGGLGGVGAPSANTTGNPGIGRNGAVVGEIANSQIILEGTDGAGGHKAATTIGGMIGGASAGPFGCPGKQATVLYSDPAGADGIVAGARDYGAGASGGFGFNSTFPRLGKVGGKGLVVVKSYS